MQISGLSDTTASRVFQVDQAAVASISGIAIIDGHGIGNGMGLPNDYQPNGGGGVLNFGTLTLSNCVIAHNTADSSGVVGGGGGILNNGGSLTVVDSTISQNTLSSGGNGAGIENFLGAVAISNSTISGNIGGSGDQIANGHTPRFPPSDFEPNVTLTASDSTISSDSAAAVGLWNWGTAEISGGDLTGTSVNNFGRASFADSRLGSVANFAVVGPTGLPEPAILALKGSITAASLYSVPPPSGMLTIARPAAIAPVMSSNSVPLISIAAGAKVETNALVFQVPGEVDIASDDTRPGALLLSGDVSFTSSAGSAAILSIGSGAMPGQLDLGGAERSFTIGRADTAVDLSIAAIVVDGSLRKDGAGVLQLSSADKYAGGTTAIAGTLVLDNADALGIGPLTFSGGTVALRTGGTPLPNVIQVNPADSISLDVGNQAMQLPTPALGAVLNLTGAPGGSLTLTGPLALRHDLVVNDSVPLTINGTISGDNGTTKTGTGTLTLGGSGSNSWAGATTVDGGTLALDKTGGAVAVPADLTINGPATVQLLQLNQIPSTAGVTFNDAAGHAVLDLNGQSLALASLISVQNGAGTVLVNGGMLSVADRSGFSGTIVSAAPTLLRTAFTDGSTATGQVQRSEIRQIVLSFDRAVTLASGAIRLDLWNGGGSGTNTGAAASNASSALGVATSSDGGFTWIIPVLKSTAFSDATGSLSDGIYTVTVHAAGVSSQSGGVEPAADSSTTFHRLFGDTNGDKTVNNSDYFQFNKAFGWTTGSSRYNPAFDVNGDGAVNNSDYFQFNKRFGKAFTY